jgi:hypothetical protein
VQTIGMGKSAGPGDDRERKPINRIHLCRPSGA